MAFLKVGAALTAVLIFVNYSSWAQEKRAIYIGGETGIDLTVSSEIQNRDRVRGEINSSSNYLTTNLKSFMYQSFVGFKIERWSLDNKFSLSTGLRFTQTASSVGKRTHYSSNSDSFYFTCAQTDNTVEYLRIKEINEVSTYGGIPLEFRYSPFSQHYFNVYFKIGVDLNFRLRSKRDVVFASEEMNDFENDVLQKFANSDTFTVLIKPAAGVKLGKNNKKFFRIELGPSTYLNNKASSLLRNAISFGPQVNILFSI